MTTYYENSELSIIGTTMVMRGVVPTRTFDINRLRDVYIARSRRWRFRSSVYELRGAYQGTDVVLFRSADAHTFGLVSKQGALLSTVDRQTGRTAYSLVGLSRIASPVRRTAIGTFGEQLHEVGLVVLIDSSDRNSGGPGGPDPDFRAFAA